MIEGFVAICALTAGAWFWLDTANARDHARMLGRRLCEDAGVQLLDQTVGLRRTFLRFRHGRLLIGREFRFEFSEQGVDRREGQLTIHGRRLQGAVLDGKLIGRTIIQP